MEDAASNDKTIGRTNRSSPTRTVRPTVVESVSPSKDTNADKYPLSTGEAPHKPTAEPPLVYKTTVGSSSKGGSFEWPTNADHYQLINRIGQGAFASVWRARIRRQIKNDDDGGAEKEETAEIHCAIKIMDLEHVNINISGEYHVNIVVSMTFLAKLIIGYERNDETIILCLTFISLS